MRIKKKTWPAYFQLVLDGKKTYELRVADFECKEGDILVLREWDPVTKKYTGRELEKTVGFVGKINHMSFWDKADLEKYGLQCISLKDAEKISKKIFDAEISLCQKMFKKKKGCAWGKCENCAVPLLLQKLYKGEVIEGKEAVKVFKGEMLKFKQ